MGKYTPTKNYLSKNNNGYKNMANRGKQKGYQLEHEVARGLTLDSTLHWKIPDAKTLGVPIPHKVPADFIINSPKGLCFVECKATASFNRLPKRNISQHQIDTGRQLSEGLYYFLIDFYSGRQHDIFIIKGSTFATLYDLNTSSIPKEDIANLGRMLKRHTKGDDPEGKSAYIAGIRQAIMELN